jgi:hypothetical protein
MTELEDLAMEMLRRQGVVEERAEALRQAEGELKEIEEERLPEIMETLGIKEFKTGGGLEIKIKETLRAHISKANEPEAFSFLREAGAAALIKNVISMSFGKGEEHLAQQCLTRLDGMPVEQKKSVHPQTLAKWCREALEDGISIPVELFGVHRQKSAVVKTAKRS